MLIPGCSLFVLTVVGLMVPLWIGERPANPIDGRSQQSTNSLTPLQLEIEKQRQRLSAGDAEEQRDALMRLGALHHPEASRAALAALKDPLPIVRATAATAVLSLPAEESAGSLVPLLKDKEEFVRKEVAYALGRTGSTTAVEPLIERLMQDKQAGVRGAAAVALGQIRDESAVGSLSQVLSPQVQSSGPSEARRKRREENVFVLRAAARSLGQIASSRALPALLGALKNENVATDVRREAATSLGLIGDPAAAPALREALMDDDAYLSQAAHDALMKISRAGR